MEFPLRLERVHDTERFGHLGEKTPFAVIVNAGNKVRSIRRREVVFMRHAEEHGFVSISMQLVD
jgi:hypothetical protein